MSRRTIQLLLVLAVLALVLSACAPGSGELSAPSDRAGFLAGIWHGWIAPVTLIWQVFDHDIRIYEPINTGWWYDFGFYMAVISGFGSLSLFRRRRGKRG
jgi:hypothetical protein